MEIKNATFTELVSPNSKALLLYAMHVVKFVLTESYGWPCGFFLDQVVWVLGPLLTDCLDARVTRVGG